MREAEFETKGLIYFKMSIIIFRKSTDNFEMVHKFPQNMLNSGLGGHFLVKGFSSFV